MEQRTIRTWLIAVVIGVAALFAIAHPAQAAPSAGIANFASKLAALAFAGDVGGLVALATPREVTCPMPEGLPGNVCEGQPAGATKDGFSVGVIFGGGDIVNGDAYRAFLAQSIDALGDGVAAYTVATGGHLLNARQCDGCYSVGLSSRSQAARTDGRALLVFDVVTEGGVLRVASVSAGTADEFGDVVIEGGTYGNLLYERLSTTGPSPSPSPGASPQPPSVGTGIVTSADGWALGWIAGGLALVAIAAGCGARLASTRSRSR